MFSATRKSFRHFAPSWSRDSVRTWRPSAKCWPGRPGGAHGSRRRSGWLPTSTPGARLRHSATRRRSSSPSGSWSWPLLEDLVLAEPGHDRAGHDLREADYGHEVVRPDLAVVELAQEVGHLVVAADLRVVVLDLPRRELAERLDLDLVDHCVEDVLARAEAHPAEDAHDHALLVLARLVAEPDRGRLPSGPKLVGHQGRVEVERVHRCPGSLPAMSSLVGRARESARPARCIRVGRGPASARHAGARGHGARPPRPPRRGRRQAHGRRAPRAPRARAPWRRRYRGAPRPPPHAHAPWGREYRRGCGPRGRPRRLPQLRRPPRAGRRGWPTRRRAA